MARASSTSPPSLTKAKTRSPKRSSCSIRARPACSSSISTRRPAKAQIPLYTAFTIDELSLPLQKENALGVPGAQQWVNDLPNAENKKFVADYRKKYTAWTVLLRRAVL